MPADDAPAATKTAKAPAAKFGKGFLFDAWYYAALSREVKTRTESVEAYGAAGRTDAAAKESAEIDIIRAYLPKQLDPAELERLVREAVDESGATSAREMGKVMALVKERHASSIEPARASGLVREMLA